MGLDRDLLDAVRDLDEHELRRLHILTRTRLEATGVAPLFRARWIVLRVNSALEGVGLTAAVSSALAEAGIACNVVAAARHDHVFVPEDRAEVALALLTKLQASAAAALSRG